MRAGGGGDADRRTSEKQRTRPGDLMAHVPLHPLWSALALDRRSGVSLQDQIANFFRDGIIAGRIQRGRRVPSSRQLALEHGISRTTAVEAYERLIAEGYLVSSQGAGVFVADALPEDLERRAAVRGLKLAPARRTPRFAKPDMRKYQLPLAPGMPAIDQFPWAEWAKMTARICREQPLNPISYGDPQGELPLREAIAEYLSVARGIVCGPEQIIVVSGSERTLEFAAEQLAPAGATVWTEEPGHPFERNVLRGLGLNPVPVPVDAQGLDVEAGRRVAPHARLAVVSPSHQYPLGVTMGMARRTALIEWSEATGAWILENELDGDYRYTSRPLTPLYALSRSSRVIYLGSLSKPLAPGLRINYLVVPDDLIGSVEVPCGTFAPMLAQLILARFSSTGRMASHMRKMRLLYAKRRALLVEALRAECAGLLDLDNLPEGGLRILTRLLIDVSDTRIQAECLAAGLKVDTLSTCYARPPGQAGLILGFASTPEERIAPAVETLAGILRRALD
jgi:GntR family transcriptional regulator/MocR family aminotransferase